MLAALVAAALGCVPPQGGWDLAELEARQPSLARQPAHRLGDAIPYFAPNPRAAELVLFLCRWETERPLRVSVAPGASQTERDGISLALAAWEGASLGLRFQWAGSEPAEIEFRFPPEEAGDRPVRVGDTIADCALGAGLGGGARDQTVDARLAFASIELNRVLYDAAGRPAPVTPEEMLGATIHELGHALGFSGHVGSRDSVMTAAPGEVRRLGARVLRGDGLQDPTLAALYGLPSGVVVGQLPVDPSEFESLFRFASLARERGFHGPFVRVGDRSGRLLWREASGRAAGSFVVRDWSAVRAHASRFSLQPTGRALALLR